MMCDWKLKIWKILLLAVLYHKCNGAQIRLRSIFCNITDPNYARVDRCDLKAVSRNVQYFTAKVTVFELPITDMSVRVQLMQRLSGWRPFLYDRTVGCNFTKDLNALTRLAWNLAKKVSNINHDCPFNQTFEVPRVSNTNLKEALNGLPIPLGIFGVFVTVKTDNITRGYANFQVSVE